MFMQACIHTYVHMPRTCRNARMLIICAVFISLTNIFGKKKTAKDGTCKFVASDVAAKISAWAYVTSPSAKSETAMLNYVGSTGPASICVDASSWQYYTSGIIQKGCGNTLDHVCVKYARLHIYAVVEHKHTHPHCIQVHSRAHIQSRIHIYLH